MYKRQTFSRTNFLLIYLERKTHFGVTFLQYCEFLDHFSLASIIESLARVVFFRWDASLRYCASMWLFVILVCDFSHVRNVTSVQTDWYESNVER